MSRDFGVNQGLVEEQFLRWAANAGSVAESWRRYFDGMAPEEWPQLTSAGSIVAPSPAEADAPRELERRDAPSERRPGGLERSDPLDERPPPTAEALPPTAEALPFVDRRMSDRLSFPPTREVLDANELQGRVSALVNAYRVRGHLFADLDPLGLQTHPPQELLLERYGLAEVDPETIFATGDMAGPATLPLEEIVRRLSETYTRTIGVEFTFLEDRDARNWLQEAMESTCNRVDLSREEQLRILTKLTDAEIFEQFLHTKYIGAKRFSLEGGESVIPMLDYLTERCSELGVEEIVIGMAHRGRLNVMVNVLEMDVREIFAGFEDDSPELYIGGGDVKYHLGYSLDHLTSAGRTVHLTLAFNPSHLEFANPVVEGRVRAKQDRSGDLDRDKTLPLLVHGDAAIAGQGIVAETLNLAHLPAYDTGGTIHVVINNQIGFTTLPESSRSTRYCTDITRMLRCPVFHVNGEDPEAVAQVVRLAAEYRHRFHDDVVIDLYCYRKYGHNEGDEPRFTQPRMYAAIDQKRTVRQVYVDRLVERGKISRAEAAEIEERRRQDLERALEETRRGSFALVPISMQGLWSEYLGGPEPDDDETYETRVDREALEALLDRLATPPEWFTPHPRIRRFLLDKQRGIAESGEGVDWGTAENLAFATLLAQGVRCRVTGQDVRRGTFSHRHAVVYDVNDGRRWTRLEQLSEDQAHFDIHDSSLSENGVLGFEWGYSLDSPDALVCWEAQFGDFANSAQVIIDQFICSSEDKWQRLSGLVMLLPHGFEGQGPEHSSARLERFLALSAEYNMQVCNLTTPAQVFHALRRQSVRRWRKPLILMSPKSLLRHKRAISSLAELAEGRFERIIDDAEVDPAGARRLIFCSGKVYYDLLAGREARGLGDVALIRIEQLYPIRASELQALLARYPETAELLWVQEEPWNMGSWFSIHARWAELSGSTRPIRCVSRPASASPATGSSAAHKIEQAELVARALELGEGRP